MPILGLQQSRSAAAFREEAGADPLPPLLLPDNVLETMPVGVYICNHDGMIVRFNRRAAELWGRVPTAGDPGLLFCGAHRAYHPDGSFVPASQAPMAEILRDGAPIRDREIVFERPDGSLVAVLANLEPICDAEGRLVGAMNVLHDISELKRSHKALLAELNHRVKNALTSVQSLASQTIRGSAPIDEIRADFESRLFALNGAHTRLASSGWQAIDLRTLLQDVLGMHQNDDGTRIALGGEAVVLPPKAAVALTMIAHELATNASKHGALSLPGGRVSVAWRVEEHDDDGCHLEIDWLERDGPPVARPTYRGFGSRLIERAVVHELKGITHVSYDAEGLRCVMDFPLRGVEQALSRGAA